MTTDLHARLRAALPAAMRARDATHVSILRTTLAALENAAAVDASASVPAQGAFAADVTRRHVSGVEATAIVAAARDEQARGAAEMRTLGQVAAAAEMSAKAAILDAVLLAGPPSA